MCKLIDIVAVHLSDMFTPRGQGFCPVICESSSHGSNRHVQDTGYCSGDRRLSLETDCLPLSLDPVQVLGKSIFLHMRDVNCLFKK